MSFLSARDDNFLGFAQHVLEQAFSNSNDDVENLLSAGLEEARQALVQKIGENVSVRRIARLKFENANEGIVESYVHSNNKIAVLLALRGGDETIARDIAMHVAAINPMVIRAEDVPEDILKKESEIYSAQARESGKPEEIIEKMISGRLSKFVAEVSLLEQPFVKDDSMTVSKFAESKGMALKQFVHWEIGDGDGESEEG